MKPRPGPCPKCGGTNWRLEIEKGKPRRWRCRTCLAQNMQKLRKRVPHRGMYFGAMRRAREAGLPFEIVESDVRDILADWTCAYCSSPVGSFEGGIRPNSATLDRLIPTLGYTRSNTVLACHRCNAAKAEHTPTSLREWADRIEFVINRQNPN